MDFNLSSDSYSDNELEELLHLRVPYSTSDVSRAKQTLINQLNKRNLGSDKQRDILESLEE